MAGVYIGIGSNTGDRKLNLDKAVKLLAGRYKLTKASSIYETEPEGFRDQPYFLNCVVELETDQGPQEVLAFLKGIEREMGRTRSFRNAPRVIDLDLLFYNDSVINTPGTRRLPRPNRIGARNDMYLVVPHPRAHERRFVLAPMAEIAPDFMHPILHKNIIQLLNECRTGSRVEGWGRLDLREG